MADLYGALMAAAEEARKEHDELETTKADIKDLRAMVGDLVNQNYTLKQKLKASGELLQQIGANLASLDDSY